MLDIYHACEHLWDAAHQPFGEGTATARGWVADRQRTLLRSGAAGLPAELPAAGWEVLRSSFEPHVEHTGYAARLAAGPSIGSGLVEGACKRVIGRRLKRTEARWTVRRAERMATLCAVLASDQWAASWDAAARPVTIRYCTSRRTTHGQEEDQAVRRPDATPGGDQTSHAQISY